MTGRSSFNIKSTFLSLLILTGLAISVYSQDKEIGGVINLYRRVEFVGTAPNDNVTLTDATGLAAGDTILLIQMKGAAMLVNNDITFGIQTGYFGTPGMHEFLIISSISATKITFTTNLLNNYNTDGSVQLIRVPYYNKATVTSKLESQPWDSVSKTGGVLSLIIGSTLSLNDNIDATGKGFKGGRKTTFPGNGNCTSVAGMNDFTYDSTFINSGFKGEGVANRAYLNPLYPPLFPGYSKGNGQNLTGGGGANGRYAGGGGGSNWGSGGNGGTERSACSLPLGGGGLGGRQLLFTDIDLDFDNNFFMGGGGGGSTYETGNTTATSGASGGGMIIIVCDTIKGNGKIITAEGGSPNTLYPNASGNAGAGGGGGGGSIALYTQSYSSGAASALTITVKGGNGGNSSNTNGEGGGGGGGLILTNNISRPANVTVVYSGGLGGTRAAGSGQAGSAGGSLNTYSPPLNGFLYNSIRSAVTGDQVDSICSNMPFGVISGTIPFSGTIKWQSSIMANPADGDYTDISGATGKDYSPGLLTQTTWFRRVVTDPGPPLIVDKSKPVRIIVHPYIKDNLIGNPDTVCYAQNPVELVSTNTVKDGSGRYSFKWDVSTNNATTFTDPANNDSAEVYTPEPGLTLTSWYRRTVTSGRCVDSTAIVRINVLDSISNNKILSLPQDICFGMTFTDLTATTTSTTPVLAGGDNTYRYLWESSINGVVWGPAPGTNNLNGYQPAELPERAPMNEYKFRRIVKSGMDDVCVSTSSVLLLRDYPVLTNNNIVTAEQKVCSGSLPAILTGSDPLNGNGTYTYIWQDSSKINTVWTDITGATGRDYQPLALSDTTSYRRKVFSSACSNTSKSVRVNVHKPLANNDISLLAGGVDTTICDGADPNRFTGTLPTGGTNIAGDYAYEWQYSADNSTWNAVITAGTSQGYDPSALNSTTYYKRKVLSGVCTKISASTIKVNVLPAIGNNILTDPPVICKDYVPALITGAIPAGGDGTTYKYFWEQSSDGGTTWSVATGVNNDPSGNYQPPALSTDMKYKRKVISGANDCCSNVSNIVEIKIHTDPSSAINAGPDTILYSIDGFYQMRADPELPYETGKWSIITGNGDFTDDTDNDTEVRSLEDKNTFLWTITNGPCINKDSVSIYLENLRIPNGFSPNNDGVNDLFEILGLDIYTQEVELSILNSAGSEVFFSTDKNGDNNWVFWDGKNADGVDLPEGTYYYILKMVSSKVPGNAPVKKSGYVLLKRK